MTKLLPATGWLAIPLVLLALSLRGIASMEMPLPAPLADNLKTFTGTYRVEVIYNGPTFPVRMYHGAITGKEADAKAVERYIPLFLAEIQLYPPELITRVRLKRIVLCEELAFAGQLRAAVPDFEHNTYYLDVSRGAHNKTYQQKVIHHDFFHIVDEVNGKLYRDERWSALNPADFKYGNGGTNAQNRADTAVLTDKYPGFLNHYSTTGVEEDKAEVFANLIVDGPYVAGRIETDRVLKSKVERLKEELVAFCPEVNEKFWDRVAKMKRE
jgi:hypothetical protein